MTSEPQIEELSEDALRLLSKTCKARACASHNTRNHYVVRVTTTSGDLSGKITVGQLLVEHNKHTNRNREIFYLGADGKLKAGTYRVQPVQTIPIKREKYRRM